ncbi:YiiX/YebB-like N1pC/P60 family cysteine hydrolase [Marininema halotolerans]|uniref:Permuted papain-like amidase enzyme, YaeF/YiiX, C92 family n=1 Tax=Marininema halotolerans TaxID=1155944 RepID=A0A1I6NXS3_9BACL|nr:YiiX/YebB-like N1pC/P60 family cysteine hydrolase [Marininema halotolerans]SFS32669.1 Permuted papain-like amidase enzyme, YaeF/YiiX, C92 family [Marininema halotolerans]
MKKNFILTLSFAFILSTFVPYSANAENSINFPPPREDETPISKDNGPTEQELDKFQEEYDKEMQAILDENPISPEEMDQLEAEKAERSDADYIEKEKVPTDPRSLPTNDQELNQMMEEAELHPDSDPLGKTAASESIPDRSSGKAKWNKFINGDIAVARGASSLPWGYYRHCGVWSTSNKKLITANISNGLKVQWETQTQWNKSYSKIKGVSVNSMSAHKTKKAVKYMIAQLGEPYRLSAKTVSYSWYCSKLAWAGYKGQGTDIDKDGGRYVTVDDIYNDNNTKVFTSF